MKHKGPYAEIIVDLNTRKTDRVFHYAVPPELSGRISVGSRVLVPFGQQKLPGYITGFGYPGLPVKIREITDILDQEPIFTPELLELARWMADNYLCSTAEAFSCILSPRLQMKTRGHLKVLALSPPGGEIGENSGSLIRTPKQRAVLRELANHPGLTRKALAARAGVSPGTIDTLVKKGLLIVSCESRDSLKKKPGPPDSKSDQLPKLSPDQQAVCNEISSGITRGGFSVFLLYGVTGSGKTEVYLRAVAATLKSGRQAVTLVPEISLTPQMIGLFRERFGGKVAVLHSALAGRERYNEWNRIKNGGASVVLGTRSAVFAPVPQPGLFVIDEEHEPSYKQDDHLRYHAREAAIKRAQLTGAVVLLGSATPSLESWYKSSTGLYKLLRLSKRFDMKPFPQVRTVDLRQEMKRGARGIFSPDLASSVEGCLKRGEQVLLFLNRRGYTTFVVCRECGFVLKCPRCDISLTYHLNNLLNCHYCNYKAVSPRTCPHCGSRCIRHFGAGTQRVEEEARSLFPSARIIRMDSDSTTRRGSHEQLINTFRDRQADILIGTQMIAKGLDFPGVTLVGVMNADIALHMPDFRAAERTFQLLTQVAGRTGRGDAAGEVLVQTYCPDHYCITASAEHDCTTFYRHEMAIRHALGYPPFSHLARILFTHEKAEEVIKGARAAKDLIARSLGKEAVEVMGPAPAPLSRIKGKFRWQLVLKGKSRNRLKEIIKELLAELEKNRTFRPAVNVDINPQGMM